MDEIDFEKAFIQFGSVVESVADKQRGINCPFCGKVGKLYFSTENGLWDCKVCGLSGNLVVYYRKLAELWSSHISDTKIHDLSKWKGIDRKYIRMCNVGWNGTHYTIPCRQSIILVRPQGTPRNCYGGKSSFMQCGADSSTVWITEGWSSFMGLVETLRENGIEDRVLSVPGALAHPKNLSELDGKTVHICLDNDSAGIKGSMKFLSTLKHSICKVLLWPTGTALKYDVRDNLLKLGHKKALDFLNENLKSNVQVSDSTDGVTIPLQAEFIHPDKLIEEYRKWLHLPNKGIIDVMFGTVFANLLNLDPLWLFLVGPPGSCKTELITTISESSLVQCLTRLTPKTLVSGSRTTSGGDPSLLPKLDGRMLAIKDFTAILAMNSVCRDEIFGQLRDAYDGKSDYSFGTGLTRSYRSKFGIIAGVTPVIESYSSTSLGERFLKYYIADSRSIKRGEEVIDKALANLGKSVEMRKELSDLSTKVLARKPTTIPNMPPEMALRIRALAQYCAALRGAVSREKYTQQVSFKPVQEVGTRLARQLSCLGMGIAAFYNEATVPEWCYSTLVKVTVDTCPDRVEEIVRRIFLEGKDWLETKHVAEITRFPAQTIRYVLEDLTLLRIIQRGVNDNTTVWRLSPSVSKLIDQASIYRRESNAS